MNRKNRIKQVSGIVIVTSLFAVCLCGCTENSSTNNEVDLSKFLGTWTGNMEETSIFGFRENNTMRNMSDFRENGTNWNMTGFRQNMTRAGNITKLEFTVDTLYMTILIGNETQTISQTYTIEGDQLILSMQFTGEQPNWTQPPSDGERPLFNDSERPPFDGERPFDGRTPFNRDRPMNERTYTFSFSKDYNVLFLNGSEFVRIE